MPLFILDHAASVACPTDSGHLAHAHFENVKVPGTVINDAASDQFVFEKGHEKVVQVKPDMIETEHAIADIGIFCTPRTTRTRWARSTRPTRPHHKM